MADVSVLETEYGIYGKCVKVTNSSIELYATVEKGPRIIRFGFVGGKNFMYEDTEGKISNDLSEFGKYSDPTWNIIGGHRLWAGPEAYPRTYYPENTPIDYKLTENGVILTPKQQEWTHLQMEMEVQMQKDDKVTVIHRITNKGAWEIKIAPWALSVLAKGGKEVIPQSRIDNGLLSNRILVLWPYTKINDERLTLGDRYIMLRQDANIMYPFKIGMNNVYGWAAYFFDNALFINKYDVYDNVEYPDGGCSFETYTNQHMLELETLGPYKLVAPDETVTHIEHWSLHKNVPVPSNEDEVENIMKKYL